MKEKLYRKLSGWSLTHFKRIVDTTVSTHCLWTFVSIRSRLSGIRTTQAKTTLLMTKRTPISCLKLSLASRLSALSKFPVNFWILVRNRNVCDLSHTLKLTMRNQSYVQVALHIEALWNCSKGRELCSCLINFLA